MRRIAIIDLGTNTFSLLIADVLPQNIFTVVFKSRISVLLGADTINLGYISLPAIRRAVNAIISFKKEIDAYSVQEIRAVATSAIRTAANKDDLLNAVMDATNIKVEVITGNKEAELIYLANASAIELTLNASLIMDIGGGSTEFIIGNKNGILWRKSFLLGAARLLLLFNPEDPISNCTIKKLEDYFETELGSLFIAASKYPLKELIGSSGVFDSFVELIDARFSSMNFCEKTTFYTFNLSHFKIISNKIINSTLAERKTMKGLLLMRVEMIVISFLFVNYILKRMGIDKMQCTTWSLKEGALIELMNDNECA